VSNVVRLDENCVICREMAAHEEGDLPDVMGVAVLVWVTLIGLERATTTLCPRHRADVDVVSDEFIKRIHEEKD
jgi:hypothetical protein